MFLDASEIEPGMTLDSAICIVGAGAAGLAIAREFIDSETTVCLVESGGLRFDEAADQLRWGDLTGLPYFPLDVCQPRVFGGGTSAWGGWCRPLEDAEFEVRPWVEESGWPVRAAEMRPYYQAAHELCEIPPAPYSPAYWEQALAERGVRTLPVDSSKLETKIHRFSPPTRFGDVLRDRIDRSRNIRCVLHARALRVETDQDGGMAQQLRVAGSPGREFFISAKLFVLAAGAIENVRLLLSSNDARPDGLGNRHDLVGRYFTEQPHTRRRLLPLTRTDAFALYGERFRGRGVAARLALSRKLQEEEELLGFGANISPLLAGHESAGWLALRSLIFSLKDRDRGRDPFLRFPPFRRKAFRIQDVIQVLAYSPVVGAAVLAEILPPGLLPHAYVLECKSEQAPNRDSQVTLLPERDAYGANRVRLDWRMRPVDRRTARRGEEIIGTELRRVGLAELGAEPSEPFDGWPETLAGGWAAMGTTRMSANPRYGVVDADCRVHGVSNLFVAGPSVFPTGGTAPPLLTTVALAFRLADHLRAHLAATRLASVHAPEPLP